MPLDICYARSGDISIAYRVQGDGPLDLVYVPGLSSHVEDDADEPWHSRFYNRLASFSRLILFDKRGTGLSDRVSAMPTLEQRMDDVRAVMDALGSERAAVFGASEGGAMSALFAATYPERTQGLVLYASGARTLWAPDYPWGYTPEFMAEFLDRMDRSWGTTESGLRLDRTAPSVAHDERFRAWYVAHQRRSATPGAAIALVRMNMEIDTRRVLPAIRVPTLVLHRLGDQFIPLDMSRDVARRIPDAKFVGLPGIDHHPWLGDSDALLDEVEEFLTGARHAVEPDRVLATVLFTDIVGSTERAHALGDRRWRSILEAHDQAVMREVERYRGVHVKSIGDGLLATFDGPGRAVRCACAIRDAAGQLGLEIRAGLHTGECELRADDVAGIAVHIGARVAAEAAPGEVLVSTTVKDLVAGSGIKFEDRGARVLKGIPDQWRLFAVADMS
jgi:class 3 adenylate cyclase